MTPDGAGRAEKRSNQLILLRVPSYLRGGKIVSAYIGPRLAWRTYCVPSVDVDIVYDYDASGFNEEILRCLGGELFDRRERDKADRIGFIGNDRTFQPDRAADEIIHIYRACTLGRNCIADDLARLV